MTDVPRILLTGGGGFIGSHTAKVLRSAGFEPVTFDSFVRGSRSLVKFGPVFEGSVLDGARLRTVLDATRPVACMHFAALAYVAESFEEPELYRLNNVVGSSTLFNALAQAGVDKLVFSSSCAIYGSPERLPIREDDPKRPISPYGRTKLLTEDLLTSPQMAGLKSVSLRYFNAAGADPDGELGEMHDPEPHLIPRAIMAAVGVLPSFVLNGDDYPTDDGSAVRDYTHVSDIARAHLAALNYLLDGGRTEQFNIGLGRGYSVKQILDAVEGVTGRKINVLVGPRRAGDPAEVVAAADKARSALGFLPRHLEIDEMVTHAWQWFERHGFQGN